MFSVDQIIKTFTAKLLISAVYIEQPAMKLYQYYTSQWSPIRISSMVLTLTEAWQMPPYIVTYFTLKAWYLNCIRKAEVAWFLKSRSGILWLKKHEIIHVCALLLLLQNMRACHMCLKALIQMQVDLTTHSFSIEENSFITCFVALFFDRVCCRVWWMLGCILKCMVLWILFLRAFQLLVLIQFMLVVSTNDSNSPRQFSKYRKFVKTWNNSLLFFQTLNLTILHVLHLGTILSCKR